MSEKFKDAEKYLGSGLDQDGFKVENISEEIG